MANILGKIFKSGAESLVKSVGEAFDRNFTSTDEKQKNNIELEKVKVEMQKIIFSHVQEMESKSNEAFKLEVEDRDSARKLQIAAIASDDRFTKRFLYYLAGFVVASATGFGVGLFFWTVPEENKRLVEMFADVFLFGGAIMVLSFFFGSSKGSHDKDSIIKEAINK